MGIVTPRTLSAFALGVLITALVLGSMVLFLRSDDNAPIQVLLPTPNQNDATSSQNSSTLAGDAAADVYVYVSGAVRNPGVYPLRPGDRLQQALEAAGGATGDAQLEAVNLALRVQDAGHYHIPKVGETPTAALSQSTTASPGTGPSSTGSCGDLIDLNSASVAELESLPGIGPVRASAIISYREKHGPFLSIEEVMNVSGIGPATFDSVRDLVSVC